MNLKLNYTWKLFYKSSVESYHKSIKNSIPKYKAFRLQVIKPTASSESIDLRFYLLQPSEK